MSLHDLHELWGVWTYPGDDEQPGRVPDPQPPPDPPAESRIFSDDFDPDIFA